MWECEVRGLYSADVFFWVYFCALRQTTPCVHKLFMYPNFLEEFICFDLYQRNTSCGVITVYLWRLKGHVISGLGALGYKSGCHEMTIMVGKIFL